MASQHIGVITGANSGVVYSVVNPDDDGELDNPRLLSVAGDKPEPLTMTKIPRGDYQGALSLDDVAELVARFKR